MRYIDTGSLKPPANWINVAKAALGNNCANLWSFLKPQYENIVGKKCWFSEAINVGADNAIEHFRPKAINIKELTIKYAELEKEVWAQINFKTRPGYSFLEYELSNYRYVCTFVNSLRKGHSNMTRGKSNFFPLKLNSAIGTSLANWSTEEICLLDPCEKNDPKNLSFNDLGFVNPDVSVTKFSWDYCRVMASIEIYHLHYYKFIEVRKEIWDECKDLIEIADILSTKAPLNKKEKDSFKKIISRLLKKVDKKAPFSAVAIDCIQHYKKTYPWLSTKIPGKLLEK